MDPKTIYRLAQAPIEFLDTVSAPEGDASMVLQAEELGQFCEDPEGYFALMNGATKEEYSQWVDTEGTPRCGARNAKGERSKDVVSGGIQMSLEHCLREDGGFCRVHGGLGSKEARDRR